MQPDPNSVKRVGRISVLIKELTEKYELNTEHSRTRCITVAREIVGLLEAEDRYQRQLANVKPVL